MSDYTRGADETVSTNDDIRVNIGVETTTLSILLADNVSGDQQPPLMYPVAQAVIVLDEGSEFSNC